MEQLEISALKLRLQAIQADSDHRAMEALVRERDEELERAQNELRDSKFLFFSFAQKNFLFSSFPSFSPLFLPFLLFSSLPR